MPNAILQGYITTLGTGGITGATRADQIKLYFDALASVVKVAYAPLGLGLSGESGTVSSAAQNARISIMGDGTALHPGLGSPQWQSQVSQYLDTMVIASRYDNFFKQQMQVLVGIMDTIILSNLPTGWQFVGATGSVSHALDAHILRLNGCNPLMPATPGSAGVLTAVNDPQGALQSTTLANAPHVIHTLVGAYDYIESLPPASPATQVAIAGTSNAYTYQIASDVPTGVRKVRIYRTLFGAAPGDYFWVKDISVTPGVAYPAIPLEEPDQVLRQDWSPPSWLSCLMLPPAAAIFALCYANFEQAPGAQRAPLVFDPDGMLSAASVALGPANELVGIGNPIQSSIFGTTSIASSVTTFTASQIQTSNFPSLNIQGFLGAVGVRARITSALDGTRTPSITYSYYDAAGGFGVVKTASTPLAPSVVFPNANVGSVAVYPIPAGQVVLSVAEASATGSAANGAYVFEAVDVRDY